MYNNHPLKLPMLPDRGLDYEFVRFGEKAELVGTCPRCQARQRTGIHAADGLSERALACVKDRLNRYHVCRGFEFAALEARAGILPVMQAFGFPDYLVPDDVRPARSRRTRRGSTSATSTHQGEQ